MPCFCQGFTAFGEHAVFDLAEFKKEFMKGGMRFTGLFFTGANKLLGGFRIRRLPIQGGIGDGACGADSAEHIQFVSIKQHLGLNSFWGIFISTEAVGQNAVLDRFDFVLRPAFLF